MNPNIVQNDITYGTMKSNVTNKNEHRRNQTCGSFHILKKEAELCRKNSMGVCRV